MSDGPDMETRELKLPCLNCANTLDVDKQYPPGEFPRTLELYCSRCAIISIHYMHPPWPKVA